MSYFIIITRSREGAKRDGSLNLARELKNLWNMKTTVVPIVIGVLSADVKELVQGQEDLEEEGRVDTIQTTALLRSARILRRVQETCCHLNSREKTSANASVKYSKWSKDDNSSQERLITTTRNNTKITRIKRTIITRKQCEEKKLYGYFKRQTDEISHEMTWTWLWKGSVKREFDSLLIAEQKNKKHHKDKLCQRKNK